MTDINTIKNLLYFFPYLKKETWYMLGIGVTIYGIYIAYLIAFERYYRSQKQSVQEIPEKGGTFLDTLNDLQVEDIRFFERLSLLIRSHLEDSMQVPLATKKTPQDIRRESISHEFKEVLDICTHYEYAGETADSTEKTEVMERLKRAVQGT